MKMHYAGVWSPNGPQIKIEIDEVDVDEILEINERMHNHTDEEIRDEIVRYLKSEVS